MYAPQSPHYDERLTSACHRQSPPGAPTQPQCQSPPPRQTPPQRQPSPSGTRSAGTTARVPPRYAMPSAGHAAPLQPAYAYPPQYYVPTPPLRHQHYAPHGESGATRHDRHAEALEHALPEPRRLPPPAHKAASAAIPPYDGALLTPPYGGPPAPRTHYGKVSVLMLLVGSALGYALHAARVGAACSAPNGSHAALLSVAVEPSAALSGWLFTATPGASACGDGLFINGPTPSPANLALFLALLLWSFMGVAIGADVFMVAIERITSQETVVRRVVDGQSKEFTVLVWNGTVANLTLMALGSSAPEILLSVIEISTGGFYSGELGPSTIVGSAAFNLLCISAVCVVAIPRGEGRLIKDRSVFAITATFSVVAYLWLLAILSYHTPNIVDVAEGVVTFLLFPALVLLAYLADQRMCSCGASNQPSSRVVAFSRTGRPVDLDAAADAFGSGLTPAEQSERLERILGRPKTRAYYRVNAVRAGTGGVAPDHAMQQRAHNGRAVVEFGVAMLTPKAHARFIELTVLRRGHLSLTSTVGYRAVGGATESKGEGLLTFRPGEAEQTLRLQLVPSEAAFYIVLVDPDALCDLGTVWSCAVLLQKASSAGMLKFVHERLSVKESQGKIDIQIQRVGGSAGKVRCRLHTKDVTAIAPKDYQPRDEVIILRDGETEASVSIAIMDDDCYEADETFQVVLSDPEGGVSFDPTCDGGADKAVATVTIISDEQVRRSVDEIAAMVAFNADEVALSATSWGEQFSKALEFEGGGCLTGIVFFLALPWKLAFACAPPPRLLAGWLCFFVTLALIGLLTALIGDLATHMGCCMGLTPAITAITFVALGTSLPDTFASRTAARAEPTADASIGNITGSNSVNVFLGLGLPWMVAAFYWGTVREGSAAALQWRARYAEAPWYSAEMPIGFVVEAADLGFSVAVFTGCALVCLAVFVLRRACLGYELGGPPNTARVTAALFVFLWFVYIGASVMYTTGAFDD